jgi:SAM-dependent methyltransferase
MGNPRGSRNRSYKDGEAHRKLPDRGGRVERIPAKETQTEGDTTARGRFLAANPYRTEREWRRYEGTPQRDLFRLLRERFVGRNLGPAGWSVDIGCGPGRFTPLLAGSGARVVALDLSTEALRFFRSRCGGSGGTIGDCALIRADGLRPPLDRARFGTVAVLGNSLGFAEGDGERLLSVSASLVARGGKLLLEVAPGSGERSRYFHRLPARAIARLLRSPVRAVESRVEREGFTEEPPRRSTPGSFRRFAPAEILERFRRDGWPAREVVAVAPASGPDPVLIAATRSDPKAWDHLVAIEESIGRSKHRWGAAAAVLLALERPLSDNTVNYPTPTTGAPETPSAHY